MTHNVLLTDTNIPILQARGIFKHRLSKSCRNAASTTAAKSSKLPVAGVTIGDDLLGGGGATAAMTVVWRTLIQVRNTIGTMIGTCSFLFAFHTIIS